MRFGRRALGTASGTLSVSWLWGSQLVLSTLRVSTPLIFASLGGLLCERAGVTNIALEGLMLVGAFASAACAHALGSPWVGVLGGLSAGMALSILYAFAVIQLRANQIVAGTAINLLAAGLTPQLCKILYDSSTASPALPMDLRFQMQPIVAALILPLAMAAWLRWTPSGLWVSFAGEHPAALDSAGIRVNRVRWWAVLAGGCLAGISGASLSLYATSSFTRNMTAGRGFMAIAALIFGKWRPIPTALAAILFGFFEAIQSRLQGAFSVGQFELPPQWFEILPYGFTILILAGFVGRSRAPRHLGQVFLPDQE